MYLSICICISICISICMMKTLFVFCSLGIVLICSTSSSVSMCTIFFAKYCTPGTKKSLPGLVWFWKNRKSRRKSSSSKQSLLTVLCWAKDHAVKAHWIAPCALSSPSNWTISTEVAPIKMFFIKMLKFPSGFSSIFWHCVLNNWIFEVDPLKEGFRKFDINTHPFCALSAIVVIVNIVGPDFPEWLIV